MKQVFSTECDEGWAGSCARWDGSTKAVPIYPWRQEGLESGNEKTGGASPTMQQGIPGQKKGPEPRIWTGCSHRVLLWLDQSVGRQDGR